MSVRRDLSENVHPYPHLCDSSSNLCLLYVQRLRVAFWKWCTVNNHAFRYVRPCLFQAYWGLYNTVAFTGRILCLTWNKVSSTCSHMTSTGETAFKQALKSTCVSIYLCSSTPTTLINSCLVQPWKVLQQLLIPLSFVLTTTSIHPPTHPPSTVHLSLFLLPLLSLSTVCL